MNGRAAGWISHVLLTGAWSFAAHAQVSPRYATAVHTYARGDEAAAVEALGAVPWGEVDDSWRALQRQAKAVEKCPNCPDPFADLPVKAAVMLHVDRDAADRQPQTDVEQPPTCGGRHARRAGQLAGLLARRRETADFARRFHVAMAWRGQWQACLEDAVGWGRDGLTHFAADPELLFAVGASFEKHARIVHEGQVPLLRQALEPLRQAVAADPARIDTRIHLGRVQWRLGQLDEAQRTLEAARGAGGADDDLYLAALFLGQVHERAGRFEEAAEAFRGALVIRPSGQAAATALAHLLLSRGDSASAHELVDSPMSRRERAFDPHWNYLSGDGDEVEARVQALRLEARP